MVLISSLRNNEQEFGAAIQNRGNDQYQHIHIDPLLQDYMALVIALLCKTFCANLHLETVLDSS